MDQPRGMAGLARLRSAAVEHSLGYAWQMVVRAIDRGMLGEAELQAVVDHLARRQSHGSQEILFEPWGEQMQVSLFDEKALCPFEDMVRELQDLLDAFRRRPDLKDPARQATTAHSAVQEERLRHAAPAPPEEIGPTARVVRAVEAAPGRRMLPLEAALSLPVPSLRNGCALLTFFWVSHGGPANARGVSAPYCRVIVDPRHPDDATFERVAPGSLGVRDTDAPFRPTIGEGIAAGARKARVAAFHALGDRMLVCYALHADRPEQAASGSLDLLMSYRHSFEKLAITALRPAYLALSPAFFSWLDAATSPAVPPP